jgi:hypothetical protein
MSRRLAGGSSETADCQAVRALTEAPAWPAPERSGAA